MHKKFFPYSFGYTGDFEIRITTLQGLEELLCEELVKNGARNVVPFSRGASFEGDIGFVYKIHLMSSLGIKVLIPLMEAECSNEKNFYNCLYDFPWENWIHQKTTFKFECVGKADWLSNSMFGAVRAKDAVSDRLKNLWGQRPFVDRTSPDRWFYLHITENRFSLLLNATGDVLHRRGYRKEQGRAPLNELLAAALVRLAGLKKAQHFVDGMCGSATLAIEACLNLLSIPPGIFREQFSFMQWPDFKESLWNEILNSKTSKIAEPDFTFLCLDNDPSILNKAKANLKASKLEDVIQLREADFFSFTPPDTRGILLLNPPYGERMEIPSEKFFSEMGKRLKHQWKGWDAWMIIPEEVYSFIGLRHKKRIRVMNGKIPCFLCGYELY